MSILELIEARRVDWARHVQDLVTRTYEGADDRADRDEVFRRAFELCTPVATRVLAKIDEVYLAGTGTVSTSLPASDGAGGLIGWWELTWPLLEQAVNRFTGERMPPVRIAAIYPREFTHGHLALLESAEPRRRAAFWPFHVLTPDEAERQEATLWAIAEADFHERTFSGDLNWRLLAMPEVAEIAGR